MTELGLLMAEARFRPWLRAGDLAHEVVVPAEITVAQLRGIQEQEFLPERILLRSLFYRHFIGEREVPVFVSGIPVARLGV